MSASQLQALSASFGRCFSRRGFSPLPLEPLNVPYFPTEFNRCMAHQPINQRLRGDTDCQPDRWYAVTPAIRTKDFAQTGSGRYCTAFEALCALSYVAPPQVADERLSVSRIMLDFLERDAGLDKQKISVSLFGGGDFLGHTWPRDVDWARIWLDLGIPEEAISWVPGPKLFMLFMGDRERCGPRCEISYSGISGAPIEIGTLIWDRYVATTAGEILALEEREEHAVGVALGLERVIGAARSGGVFNFEPYLSIIADIQRNAPFWSDEVSSDALALVDALKCALFARSLTDGVLTSRQADFLRQVEHRAVRKAFLLGLDDGGSWIRQCLHRLATEYRCRYPAFDDVSPSIAAQLENISLPEAWNPAGYVSMDPAG